MYRVVRSAALRGLRVDAAAAQGLRADAEGASAEARQWRQQYLAAVGAGEAAEARIEELREELARMVADRAAVRRERDREGREEAMASEVARQIRPVPFGGVL